MLKPYLMSFKNKLLKVSHYTFHKHLNTHIEFKLYNIMQFHSFFLKSLDNYAKASLNIF